MRFETTYKLENFIIDTNWNDLPIGFDWLCDKFRRITSPLFTRKGQDVIINLLENCENISVREIVHEINKQEYWKE